MEPWTFPSTWPEIWNGLESKQREEILTECVVHAKARRVPQAISFLAEKLHTREQELYQLPTAELVSEFRTVCNNPEALAKILFVYFSEAHTDLFDGPHKEPADLWDSDDPEIPAHELEKVIANLLRHYPFQNVRLLTQCVYMFKPERWCHLPDVDFAKIEVYRNESDSGETENDEDPFEDP